MRSGTARRRRCTVGLAVATSIAVAAPARAVSDPRGGAARPASSSGILARGARTPACHGHPVRRRLPGLANLTFPGCEGDALLMLLDARGVECSTGSACSAGVAQPSHVLTALGASPSAGPRIATVLARPRLHRRPTSRRRSRRSCPAVDRARRAGLTSVAVVKLLAAMSGGVDSAVAAARAVDAGHDVTGVHLALSAQPADAAHRARAAAARSGGRPRRPPRRRRTRHPLLRLGSRRAVPRRGDRRLRRLNTRPAARPTRACAATRRSSSPPCSTARSPSASTPSSPATTPGWTAAACGASVDEGKDQSYVLAVCTP